MRKRPRVVAAGTRGPLNPNRRDDADQLVRRGLECHSLGRLSEADGYYSQALRLWPDHADALNLGGAAAFALGRTDDAVGLITKAIQVAPTHRDAYLNLAEALEKKGKVAEAMQACEVALKISPDISEAYARLAWLQTIVGRTDLALAYCRVALGLDPQSVQALCARGAAYWRCSKPGEAEAAYRAALSISPHDLRSLTGLGSLLCETDRASEAEDIYAIALSSGPEDPAIIAGLGRVLESRGDIEGALALYDRAGVLSGGALEMLYNRGRCLRDVGRFDEAEHAFRTLLTREPQHGPSLYALVRMKRLAGDADQLRRLGRLTADDRRPALHRVQAGFAAGELLDRAGDADMAFRRFSKANILYAHTRQASGESFDRSELRCSIDLIINRFAREYVDDTRAWGVSSETPVFVVGMPRSGTTLVEQICASHSQVAGAGELRHIQTAARLIAQTNEGLDRISDWDSAFARATAVKLLRELESVGRDARRVIDKSPLNIMRLGIVGALFPNARVIWCRRDLRDVVVSNHTMYFGQGNLYSTDQSDTAYFARQVERLGACWVQESQLKILEVEYENLVSDLETNARRLIDFLGLNWEAACLDFHKTNRHVETPSSWQVRQPIYQGSVGRWRRFEAHLGPMLKTLSEVD